MGFPGYIIHIVISCSCKCLTHIVSMGNRKYLPFVFKMKMISDAKRTEHYANGNPIHFVDLLIYSTY